MIRAYYYYNFHLEIVSGNNLSSKPGYYLQDLYQHLDLFPTIFNQGLSPIDDTEAVGFITIANTIGFHFDIGTWSYYQNVNIVVGPSYDSLLTFIVHLYK